MWMSMRVSRTQMAAVFLSTFHEQTQCSPFLLFSNATTVLSRSHTHQSTLWIMAVTAVYHMSMQWTWIVQKWSLKGKSDTRYVPGRRFLSPDVVNSLQLFYFNSYLSSIGIYVMI